MLKNVKFIKSAMTESQIPHHLPGHHVVLCGRSNVGKSSLINALTNNQKLAKISQRPGKTQTLNFFLVDGKFQIVDLPGYGYAKVNREKQAEFLERIEEYFETNERRKILCLIIDIRVQSPLDVEMLNYLKTKEEKILIIANKCDKLSNNKRIASLNTIAKYLNVKKDQIILVSAHTKFGLSSLEHKISHL